MLDKITEQTKIRIAERKKFFSESKIISDALAIKTDFNFPFEKALSTKDISFICEVKKASPSKGIISEDFPYLSIARDYELAGAEAISVLTEPYFFKGNEKYLREISKDVKIPVLRKDFTIDSYMIYEAKLLGASAVLLICAILNSLQLREYIEIAHSLGLSALVETHTEDEVEKGLKAGARIIGVNNRNLKTFDVDITTSIKLRSLVPHDIIFISESGIKTPQDVDDLRKNGVDAVLIGETLMRSKNKKAMLDNLRGNII
ncbi:MAG: indole-3-glycerol phosphate synthase [Clostridiales bacterium GWF2_36_10]|nr:MAG: indole-3-glycerol phosphate synthase [Clostridiales bacterium GWF2_36_10]HAN20385.1 indole-3-glycerol phosphate synthase TrpC [Clostridiales bacterium]